MKVLLIGSGGREHALAWKLAQSARLDKLYVAPGNGGTSAIAENVMLDVTDHRAIITFCRMNVIDLAVIGPEAPLVAGLADDLRAAGVSVFGPSRAAARLEGSKAFTKALCDEMGIPTARYRHFDGLAPALAYVRERGAPIVIKADGLAAGKGVAVAATLDQAEAALRDCFAGTFGAAGAEVVIEDCLSGEEVSIFAIADGERYVTLASAQDHKRALDNDEGPNTGGMGAYSPAFGIDTALIARIENEIIGPTIAGMARRGTPFQGVLYAGLMLTPNGPMLIEYNVRFGDPECQALMMRMRSDLIDLLEAAANGDISNVEPAWCDDVALTVVMAARGYPGAYRKDTEIRSADSPAPHTMVFHAGTSRQGKRLLASGGRVLNVTALGRNVAEAQERAYMAVDKIEWADGFCRRDIGGHAVARERRGS